MFRMIARRDGQVAVGSQGDDALWGISLPSDTVIHDIYSCIKIRGNIDQASVAIVAYSLEMWILPMLDPDTATTYSAIMDKLVPKDTDTQTLDLDTDAADTEHPFWEPGEADWSKVLDVGLQPERIYHTHEYMTIATPGVHIHQQNQSPYNLVWLPLKKIDIRIKRRLRVNQPSVLVLGMASPSLDDTTQDEQGPLLADEWSRVKYAEQMLEQTHMDLLGLSGSGNDEPWADASDLLQKHVRPDVYEESADRYAVGSWEAVFDTRIDHSVTGKLGKKTLSLG